jgi:hypothetical protein
VTILRDRLQTLLAYEPSVTLAAALKFIDDNQPWHGTSGGYYNHGCRCDNCRAAASEMARAARLRRMENTRLGLIDVPHGSDNAYKNYGCRCDECRAARAAARRGRLAASEVGADSRSVTGGHSPATAPGVLVDPPDAPGAADSHYGDVA